MQNVRHNMRNYTSAVHGISNEWCSGAMFIDYEVRQPHGRVCFLDCSLPEFTNLQDLSILAKEQDLKGFQNL